MPVPGKMWRFERRGGIITQDSGAISRSLRAKPEVDPATTTESPR